MSNRDSESDLFLTEQDGPDLREQGTGDREQSPSRERETPAASDPKDLAALAKKLLGIMAEIGGVVKKTGFNAHLKKNYSTTADLAEAMRGKLVEKNVLLLPDLLLTERYEIETKETGNREQGTGSVKRQAQDVTVRYTFLDCETGASLTVRAAGTGMDSGDKAVSIAQTGALRAVLRSAFLIYEDDEPDAGEKSGRQPREQGTGNREQRGNLTPAAGAPAGPVPSCSQGHGPLVWKAPKPTAQRQWTPFWGCRNYPNCTEKVVPEQPVAEPREPGV